MGKLHPPLVPKQGTKREKLGFVNTTVYCAFPKQLNPRLGPGIQIFSILHLDPVRELNSKTQQVKI